MVVPYYHRNTPNQDIRSFMARFSFEDEDIIHEDFTKIMNLEMRLTDSIQFQQLEEDKSVSLTGTAVTYPGLEPYEGDLFILEVDNKQQVVMIVNKVDPTTFRQERYYQVQFTAYMQLSKILYERIEMMVRDTCYFERKKYFGESELTFLSEKSWFILKELEAYRRKISQDIISFFYNKDRESFFRVDGVYDPYLTEFLRHKLTVRDNRVHPLQLLVPLQNFEYSIWFKLLDAENCESLTDVWKYAIPRYKDPRYFTSDFNALVGKYYLELVEDTTSGGRLYPPLMNMMAGGLDGYGVAVGTNFNMCNCRPMDPRYPHLIKDACAVNMHHPHPKLGYTYHYPECPVCSAKDCDNDEANKVGILFTEDFYSGYMNLSIDPLAKMIYEYLTEHHKLNIEAILKMVKEYRKLGKTNTALYKMALYLELIDGAIVAIK